MSQIERGVIIGLGIGTLAVLLSLGALVAFSSAHTDVITVNVLPTDAPARVPTQAQVVASPTKFPTTVEPSTNTAAPSARSVSPSAIQTISLTSTPTVAPSLTRAQ